MPTILFPSLRLLIATLTVIAAMPTLAADARDNGLFHAENVSKRGFGRTLNLPDATGKVRTLPEFHGKVVLLYFGFLSCPDVCPTELTRLTELRRRFGPEAGKIQVLFVTLDPQRDSAVVLRDYVSAFDSSFIALRGNPEATAAAVREFRVVHQMVPGSTPERYTIDHSAYVYAIDPAGRLRLRFDPGLSVEKMREDVATLLGGR